MLIKNRTPKTKDSLKTQVKPTEKIDQSRLPKTLVALLQDLNYALEHRCYTEAERIGHDLLEFSPSEEVDRYIHEIISSAVSIIDAEDEINYQFSDLETALNNTSNEDLASIKQKELDRL
jgi:hypothetical protein